MSDTDNTLAFARSSGNPLYRLLTKWRSQGIAIGEMATKLQIDTASVRVLFEEIEFLSAFQMGKTS